MSDEGESPLSSRESEAVRSDFGRRSPVWGKAATNILRSHHVITIAIDVIIDYNDPMQPHEPAMPSVTIRNIDPAVKERLRVRAAQNGRSMEAELRAIVIEAIDAPVRPPELNLYDRIRARFELLGGVELELPPRGPVRDPPTFE